MKNENIVQQEIYNVIKYNVIKYHNKKGLKRKQYKKKKTFQLCQSRCKYYTSGSGKFTQYLFARNSYILYNI